jgi:hypothetical protein
LRDSLSDRDDRMMCYEYARAYLNDALWIESAKTPAVPAKAAAKQQIESSNASAFGRGLCSRKWGR